MNRIVCTAIVLTFTLSAGHAFAQDAAKGKQLFTDQKCTLCHSAAGQGNKKGPIEDAAKLSAADIRAWITDAPTMAAKAKADRKPPMKAYTDLSKEDVDSLVAYIQSLKK